MALTAGPSYSVIEPSTIMFAIRVPAESVSSSAIGSKHGLYVEFNIGALLTALTTIVALLVAVLNGVIPPLLFVSTLLPAIPEDLSQALKVKDALPLK